MALKGQNQMTNGGFVASCVFIWKGCAKTWERASAQSGQFELKISADWQMLGLFLLSVKASLDWCEVAGCVSAAVCLRCLAGFGTSEPREEVFPTTDRCVKAELALENLSSVTSNTPLSASPWQARQSEMSLLFNLKQSGWFLKHFSDVVVVGSN